MNSTQMQMAQRPGLRVSAILGTTAVLGGFAYFLYRNYSRSVNPEFDLPRDTLLRILRDFRKEFYTLCKEICENSKSMQNELFRQKGMSQTQAVAFLKEMFESEGSNVPQLIQDVENKVYLKYDITSGREFQRYYDSLAKNDPEVRQYKDEMREMYEKAVQGKLTDPNIDIPDRITPEMVMSAIRQISKATLQKLIIINKDLVSRFGKAGATSSNYTNALNQMNLNDEGNRIALEFGLDFNDRYHPHELIRMSTEKLNRSDPDFARKYKEIESFKVAMIIKMQSGAETEVLLEDLKMIDEMGLSKPEPPIEPVAVQPPLTKEPQDHNEVIPSHVPDDPIPDNFPSNRSEIALTMNEVLESVPFMDARIPRQQSDSDNEH